MGPDTSILSVEERAARCVKTEEDARTNWLRYGPNLRPQNGPLALAHRRPEVDPASSNCLFVLE